MSQAIAEHYIRIGAVPARKCSVIHNGIDLDQFSPDAGERSRLRERFHVGDSFVWLAAGRISRAKDYPNLLRAFAAVCAAEARTQLWIAGEAQHQEDRESELWPHRLASKIECVGWVSAMTWPKCSLQPMPLS